MRELLLALSAVVLISIPIQAEAQQCSNPRTAASVFDFAEGFTTLSSAQEWCFGYLDQFGLSRDSYQEYCSFPRQGRYGRYTWNANFEYYFGDYGGNGHFRFEHYCGD